MAHSYDKGDLVRISAAFKNSALALVDPNTVTFTINQPDGTVYTKQYGIGYDLVKDSVGNYHIDYYIIQSGIFSYRFSGAGAVTAAGAGMFSAS